MSRSLTPGRRTVAVVLIAVTLGGWLLGMTGYNHGLPFVDFGDEMTMWTRGRALIDPAIQYFQPEYPPAMGWVLWAFQRVQIALGDTNYNASAAVAAGRITSVTAYALTGLLLMFGVWRMAEPVAGRWAALLGALSAGTGFMLLPFVVARARTTMPDLAMTLFFVAAVVAAQESWRKRAPLWAWVGVGCAILSALFKWQSLPVLLFPPIAFFALLPNRGRVARHLIAYGIVFALFIYWMVAIHGAFSADVYYPGTEMVTPTPASVLDNAVYVAAVMLPWPIFALLPLAGLILALVVPDYRPLWRRDLLWVLPPLYLGLSILVSVVVGHHPPHQYLPLVALLALLAGLGMALVVGLAARLRLPTLRLAGAAAALAIFVIPLPEMVRGVADITADHLRPDRQAILAGWTAQALTDGMIASTDRTLAAALEPIYGYNGPRLSAPEWGFYTDSGALDAALLAEGDIRYLIAPAWADVDIEGVSLTPLLSYGDDPTLRGVTWTAYEVGDLPPITSEPLAVFGSEIALRGLALSPVSVCPGDEVTQRLIWSAVAAPTQNYSYYLHLVGETSGELSFPYNGEPLANVTRPTSTWTYAGEVLPGPEQAWIVPDDVTPGVYALHLGIYEPLAGTPLLLTDGQPYVILPQRLTVRDC